MLKVLDIMSPAPITVQPEMSLRQAMARLVTEQISGAPVEDSGRVVGVITCRDLLVFAAAPLRPRKSTRPARGGAALEQPGRASVRHPERADEGAGQVVPVDAESDVTKHLSDSFDLQPNALDEYTVRDAMTTTVHTIDVDADVSEAAILMVGLAAHRLVVVQENRLVGIVTTTDVTTAVADGRLRDLVVVSRTEGESKAVSQSENFLRSA